MSSILLISLTIKKTSLAKKYWRLEVADLIWQALERFSTKTLFTLDTEQLSRRHENQYRIEILFTHTNSDQFRGDFCNEVKPSQAAL